MSLPGLYDFHTWGVYNVTNNDWGGKSKQVTWTNSASCWGTDAAWATVASCCVGSYPNVSRGWSGNAAVMSALSTSGTNDWTTKAGLGLKVSALTKAKVHWAFSAPTTARDGVPPRWMALMDVYFHTTNHPAATEFPPYTDLMIDQALADQDVSGQTFYGLVATNAHAFTVTLGGNTYLGYIDEAGEAAFHNGGHNIHLFLTPTSLSTPSAGTLWGAPSATTDLKAIIDFFRQANPRDDQGNALHDAAGTAITTALLPDTLYLNAINAGFEIDQGTTYRVDNFWVSLQDEPDGPPTP